MTIKGIGTRGLAAGRAFMKPDVHMDVIFCGDATAAFKEAYDAVHADLEELAEKEDVFAAHLEMLEDPMLSESIEAFLGEDMPPVAAVQAACEQVCGMSEDTDDEYLRARVDDVRDVCRRLERKLCGDVFTWGDMEPGSVVVADELLPSDTAEMDMSKVSAFVTHRGSRTSHVCIIAGNHGVPVVVGTDISGITKGDVLLVDAYAGEVIVCPTPQQMKDFEARLDMEESSLGEVYEHRFEPAVTREGKKIPVFANAGNIGEVVSAMEAGADGIGLFRTEFVFMLSNQLPSESIQFETYRDAVLACKGKPLTIRTLDIGGDKALPYMDMPKEENPFLGLRGIRFSLAHPEIMCPQLRAILRASVFGPVRIMFPMVDTVEELSQALACLDECKLQLTQEGISFDRDIEVGIMIETPAAVIMADKLAQQCSFFSIGTNDLTQYIMAADRGNASVSYLYNALSQPVARAVAMTIDAAHRAGIRVAMCGELASDLNATALLLGLGLDAFSVASPAVPSVKENIRK
ncbi:MAG: phosphoenolpyruvate--protein phosphotransferase [Bacteroidales bacterium]|nr:phosphoenolpyruvate--protein phosphotransferase [Bacteroidales bacterium]